MRLTILFFAFLLLLSCEKNSPNDILPDAHVDITINLDLPQFVNLQTPTGWVYVSGGLNGVFVRNTGIGSPPFKAFERACPNNDCTVPMTFDGSLKLTCQCDDSTYSIIDGSPQSADNNNFARKYRVIVVSNSTINIRNF